MWGVGTEGRGGSISREKKKGGTEMRVRKEEGGKVKFISTIEEVLTGGGPRGSYCGGGGWRGE